MSLGEADGKFPTANEGTGLPPPATPENPGQVYPKSSPRPSTPLTPMAHNGVDQYVGNPYLIAGALRKVDKALGEVIAILEDEERSYSGANEEGPLLRKFRRWREDVYNLRGDTRTPLTISRASPRTRSRSPEAGGMFVD